MDKESFKCDKCGFCCHYSVKASKEEIKKISNGTGLAREEFIDGSRLIHKNGFCVFLKRGETESICGIYEFRPEICKIYPFNIKRESCRPDNWKKVIDLIDSRFKK